MNEWRVLSFGEVGVDRLWTEQALNDSPRIDPISLENPVDPSLIEGTVFEIDYIRIREDFRFDFHTDHDGMGLGNFTDVDASAVADGFFHYTSSGDPSLGLQQTIDVIDTAHFSQFVIGMDNPGVVTPNGTTGLLASFGSAEFYVGLPGRYDGSELVDAMTEPQSGWSALGRLPIQELGMLLPMLAATEQSRVDYIGLTPANPYGLSMAVFVPTGEVDPEPELVFLRGDANGNGTALHSTDAVRILRHLFGRGNTSIDCPDAADVDNSGSVNIRDAVLVLLYFFGRLDAPPDLLDGCQTDATEDDLPECEYREGLCEDARVALRRGERTERYWRRASKR